MGSLLLFYRVAPRSTTRVRGRHGSSGAAPQVFPRDEPARVWESSGEHLRCVSMHLTRQDQQARQLQRSIKKDMSRLATLRLIIHEKTFLSKWMVSKDGGHILEQHLGFADGYVFSGCLSFFPHYVSVA